MASTEPRNQSRVVSKNVVGYEGYVRITYNNRGKSHSVKLFNEGTKNLGDLISIAIAGDTNNINTIINRCPSYLDFETVQNKGTNDEEIRSLLTTSIPLTSKVWGPAVNDFDSEIQNSETIIGKAQFSAVISSNFIIRGRTLNAVTEPRLKLTNNLGQDLAYIYDKNVSNKQLPLLYNALVNNQDALIDWIMYIMNAVIDNTGGGN